MRTSPSTLVLALGLVACSGTEPADAPEQDAGDPAPQDSGTPAADAAVADEDAGVLDDEPDAAVEEPAGMLPLNDLGSGTYLGFEGGLYEGGTNELPADHAEEGRRRAAAIEPLDTTGQPDPAGRIVLLSIGMSNTTIEWCARLGTEARDITCDADSFIGMAAADPSVDTTRLSIVDGAAGGQTAEHWDDPAERDYDMVRDVRLASLGLTEAQVQVVWLKEANAQPRVSLPDADADAYLLEEGLGMVLRAMKVRYPNLQQVFLSSRIYAGYATTDLNPEPFAYETGLSVKWVVQAQIDQMRAGGGADARAGDLSIGTASAWLAWGPYLWADGTTPRSDGLVWERTDLRESDGTHPAEGSGQRKVARLLLDFFSTSPMTSCWFLAGGRCDP